MVWNSVARLFTILSYSSELNALASAPPPVPLPLTATPCEAFAHVLDSDPAALPGTPAFCEFGSTSSSASSLGAKGEVDAALVLVQWLYTLLRLWVLLSVAQSRTENGLAKLCDRRCVRKRPRIYW